LSSTTPRDRPLNATPITCRAVSLGMTRISTVTLSGGRASDATMPQHANSPLTLVTQLRPPAARTNRHGADCSAPAASGTATKLPLSALLNINV
jgi:hypothetical protein